MMTSFQRVNAFAELRARKWFVSDTLRHALTTVPIDTIAEETHVPATAIEQFARCAVGKKDRFVPLEDYLCRHGHLRIVEADR